jgi:hypothetical protein
MELVFGLFIILHVVLLLTGSYTIEKWVFSLKFPPND